MKYIKYWVIVCAILAISASFQGGAVALFKITKENPKIETRPIPLLERLIYERVNEERAKYNLLKLQWASDVAEVARKHSEDMALREYFAHENKWGESTKERLEKAGIVFTVSAENLFKCENYPDVVEESIKGWMESPGHRENILNDKVEETGLGIYKVSGKDEYYITQNFIKRALKFVPLPTKLSEEEINKIFNLIKEAITSPDDRNFSLKDRILKKFINSGIPIKKDFIIEGFWGNSPALKLKADLIIDNGFIVNFTDIELEEEKENFARFITSQGYSAIVLIRATKEKIEYVLIKSE
ncbi:MAG: CAP domain-containing protein [Candidatus Ratteibacteria bacterium]|nr:CAP domain-containing protein [Candidatus Ratteibacteria bacterium]